MSSFKLSENIQKKRGGLDRSVSDTKLSSVTLGELALKARKHTVISSFSNNINPNGFQMNNCLEYMNINLHYFLISQNISTDLEGPKVEYKLHYGQWTGPLFRAATRHNASWLDNKLNYKK